MRNVYECDLHGHTNRSDGNDTPKEFIDHAIERGVKVAAITDHDVIPPMYVDTEYGQEEICTYAKRKGLILLKGIEISAETCVDDLHLVCFGCDWNVDYFADLDQFTIKSKVNSYQKLISALRDIGMDITWEEVLENGGHPVMENYVQKKMIFELMVRKGYADSWSAAKLFVKTMPNLNIRREKPSALEVIHQVHTSGGIAIMAHPYLVKGKVIFQGIHMSREDMIDILIEHGLDGIEAAYTYDKTSYGGTCKPEEIEEKIVKRYAVRDFIISGGSDYHNDGKKGVENPRDIGDRGISFEQFCCYDVLKRIADIG